MPKPAPKELDVVDANKSWVVGLTHYPLEAQVAANGTAIDSAIVLINGIADRITAAGVDPAKLAALTADLKAKDDALAAAVVANTPAAASPA